MNFPLKYLENHLAETWLLSGEEWMESEGVENLTEVERHLWMARVEGFEVEVQISPSKVRAFSCECADYKREGGCGHIAAVLLALRKREGEKEMAKKEKPEKTPSKKVTIPGLLHHVEPEDLAEFVRDYARQNRPFALALKARFTSILPDGEKKQKYLELLDATLASVRTKNDQVNFRGARQLVQVTRELVNQAEEAIHRHSLQEATELLTSVLEKIGPVSRKTTGKDKGLQEEIDKCFTLFRQLLLLKPAPQLLYSIWDFTSAEGKKFIFRKSGIQMEYFRLMVLMAPELGKTEELNAFLNTRLGELDPTDPNRVRLLILIHQLLTEQGDTTRIQAHLLDHLHEPAFVLFVVEEAISTGHWKKARFLAEKGLESSPDPALEEHLLQLALREKDGEAVVHFASARFLQTRQAHYLDPLKSFAGKGWSALVDNLIGQLEQQPWSMARRDAVAQLLFRDQRFDELFQYITRLQSLDLLMAFGPSWPTDRMEQAEQMYLEVLQIYLGNHLGRKPSQRVRESLEGLMETGLSPIADRILARFRADYANRQSLMDELEALKI